MNTKRIAMIGLDAVEWWELEKHAQAGIMPNVSKFLSTANVVPLRMEIAFRSESIWTEWFTGRTRHENRYWTMLFFNPSNYTTWETSAYRATPFYARPDIVPVVLDVPHLPLAPEARGTQVLDWGSHSPMFPPVSQPRMVLPDVEAEFGLHPTSHSESHVGWHSPMYRENLAAGLASGVRTRAEVISRLLDITPDWNLAVALITEPHVSAHSNWHGVDPEHMLFGTPESDIARELHERVMVATDDAIGELMSTFGEDTEVVLAAGHGMQPNGADVGAVLFSELLHRVHQGRPFLDLGPFDPDEPPIVLPPHLLAADYLEARRVEPRASMAETGRLGQFAKSSLARARRWNPALARTAESSLRRVTGRASTTPWWELQPRPPADPWIDINLESRRIPIDYQVPSWYRNYWPKQPVFVIPSFSDIHFRVNLAGREAAGTVAPADYERVLDETEALLRACTDPRTGRSVATDVARTRSEDPFDPEGPPSDLCVTCAMSFDAIAHDDVGTIGPVPLLRTGEHSERGWVATQGNKQRISERSFSVSDLAPTLLDLGGFAPSPMHTGTSFADLLR